MMDLNKAAFLFSCGLSDQLPAPQGAEIVFCGRSNVGKSSLLNKLCNRKSLARVSATPGKTTTVNYFSAGDGYYLVDLPGYGYAKRSQAEKARWAKLLEYYFVSGRDIRLALLLLDMRHAPSEEDGTMLAYLRELRVPMLIVLTKADKLNKTEFAEQRARFDAWLCPYAPRAVVPFSVQGEADVQQLRDTIKNQLNEG
ncbi:MAG: ribosome biogenesis GTP-binding protein YihA/YsxC [Oscillospiraceae bacterium]|nr:ribosome biogenesis GTP-binding protein YihA/YsxC [Oscillospiraceae bacterium]